MKPIGRISTLKQIIRLERAVRQAEMKIIPPWIHPEEYPDNRVSFSTHGPRRPVYAATPLRSILEVIGKAGLPKEGHFADLGSGLGMACFVASFYFSQVTGFEFDHEILAEAEKIRQRFNLNNVRFLNIDFLRANINPYNVIYMFHPFLDNFSELIVNILKETKPGTVIISHVVDLEVFSKDLVLKRYYPNFWKSHPDKDQLPGTFVYERK